MSNALSNGSPETLVLRTVCGSQKVDDVPAVVKETAQTNRLEMTWSNTAWSSTCDAVQ